MAVTETSRDEVSGGYRHEALLYSGLPEYVSGTTAFVRRAVNAGEPVLVVVDGEKIDLLRRQLGAQAEHVTFADMALVGDNPGRIIAYWQAFVADNADASQLWGIGEPIYPGRTPTELAECQLHESLLNVAFDAATPFWLLCPYDLGALAGDVIDEARRSHPFLAQGKDRRACPDFRQMDFDDPFNRPPPPRPAGAAAMWFEPGRLRELRSFVTEQARLAGLDSGAAPSVVLSVNEIASNSLRHGGGRGELHAWTEDGSFVCEVRDEGHITSPLAGRLRPALGAEDGAGLWLANQLCDLVQIFSSSRGTAIRVHQDL
jgi:anti-sigma regulatory factor (Ser/Thr protein kinase)